MKKKALIIIISAVVLIGCIAWVVTLFSGNPISKLIATNVAQKYLKENYGDKDFVIDDVQFNFKNGYYYAEISSPSSIDSSFSLELNSKGEIITDDYESRVLDKWNTADRIGRDYTNAVNNILEAQSFPYNKEIGYGFIEFIPREFKDEPFVPKYAIITEDLVLDATYDIAELGSKSGKVVLWLKSETVSHEKLAEILLDLKKIFDTAGVKFYEIDLTLEPSMNKDGYQESKNVEVANFLYSDIYENGLSDRVRASDEKAKAQKDNQ